MCGILGSININNTINYLHLIEHRGPDTSDTKSFNINGNIIDLIHRRLSILDLSKAGDQPMFSYDNKACIIFNGEIYNHFTLKSELEEISFNGHSDTETIVNYFKKFDITKKLKDLNGIFSLAYLDMEKELLYLARDRFGIKPLYFWFENNQLLFSSEIRPLRAILKPSIEEIILINSLRMRYTPSPSTIYQKIYKVEPGQLLIFNFKTGISVEKTYFVKTPKSLGTKKKDYKKLVEEYGYLFEKAVERQLMSDVEVGILLSGGVDSALIASIAKGKSNSAVKTFSIGFEGNHNDIDEIEYAEETATILGLEHLYKKIDFSDVFNSIKKIIEIVEEPVGTTSIIPMYFLSELAASKVKVVLSGQGADEPLGGYNKYKGLPWLEYSRLLKIGMPLAKSAKFIYNKNEKLRRLACAMQHTDNIDSLIEFNAIFSMKEIKKLINVSNKKLHINELKSQQRSFKQIWEARTPNNANIKDLFLYYDLRTSLADDLLMYTDKITMHFSLECRVPVLDNDLIDFIESLDTRYKFNPSRGKIIHKDFAKEYLPSSIIERKKLGFKSPTETWFRENMHHIETLFKDKKFCKWFDLNAVKKLLSDHCNGRNLEKHIFLLLSIYYILKQNEDLD